MVKPQAARFKAGSGRRPIAACTAGPSSIINSKLRASGSQRRRTAERGILDFGFWILDWQSDGRKYT